MEYVEALKTNFHPKKATDILHLTVLPN